MDYDIINRILCVAPNFGAVWVGVGLTISYFPYAFKKEFNENHIYLLGGIILVLLLISEIIHHFFLGSLFDIWDMLASAGALLFIILVRQFRKHNQV